MAGSSPMPAYFPTGIKLPTTQRCLSAFLQSIFTQRSNLSQILAIKMGSQGPSRRPFCRNCSKPARLCLCSRLQSPPLDNSITVTILQHSLEKCHPLNSTRVAKLGLKNLAVITVTDVNFQAQLLVRPAAPNQSFGLSGIDEMCWEKLNSDKSSNFAATQFNMVDKLAQGAVNCCITAKCGYGCSIGCSKNLQNPAGELNPVPTSPSSISTISNGPDFATKHGTDMVPISGLQCNGHCLLSSPPESEEDAKVEPFQLERLNFDHDGQRRKVSDECITITMDKCKVTCSPCGILITVERSAKPDISWVLKTPIGRTVISNGFVVTKLQRRQLRGTEEFQDFEEFEIVMPPGSALLFPSEKSISLEAVDFEVKHLIVLDGTWAKAKRIYYENPWLKLLPHLKLESGKESLYSEVRHQPKAGCLSTIESIVYALKALGDDMEGLDSLLDVFESMVGDQKRCKEEKFRAMSLS